MLVRLHACMHACLLASRFSCRTDCVSAVRLGYVENQDMSQHALSDKAVELISTRSLDKKNKSTLTFQETCSDVPLATLPMPICHGSLTLISVPPTFTFAYGTGYKEWLQREACCHRRRPGALHGHVVRRGRTVHVCEPDSQAIAAICAILLPLGNISSRHLKSDQTTIEEFCTPLKSMLSRFHHHLRRRRLL
jgi:hypothetical protein